MRETILANLKVEMESALITPTSTCKKILRGIYLWEDCLVKPAIVLTCSGDKVINFMKPTILRKLQLFIYGYSNNLESVHSLADETESFFRNEYTLSRDIFVGDMEIIEGKSLKENELIIPSLFSFEMEHKYEVNF